MKFIVSMEPSPQAITSWYQQDMTNLEPESWPEVLVGYGLTRIHGVGAVAVVNTEKADRVGLNPETDEASVAIQLQHPVEMIDGHVVELGYDLSSTIHEITKFVAVVADSQAKEARASYRRPGQV